MYGEEQIMTRNQTASQTIVVVAMGLVVGASCVALYQHAGVPGPIAATAALAAYLLLVTVHTFAWRGGIPSFGRTKTQDRRGQELRRLKDDGRGQTQGAPPQGHGIRPDLPPHTTVAQAQRGMSPGAPSVPQQHSLPQASGRLAPNPPHAGMPPPLARGPERAAPPPLPAHAPKSATPAAQSTDELDDFLAYRPAKEAAPKLPPFVTGRVAGQPAEPAPQRVAPAPARQASPREADVEVIQDAIKRLLEEVNAAEQNEARAQGAGSAPPSLPAAAPERATGGVDRSIDALRMTAGSMRSAIADRDAPPAMPAPPRNQSPAPQPPPLPPFVRGAAPQPRTASAADTRARLMADAISAGRIDVALEPILGLEDQQTRHYEVTVRLRDPDGNALELTPDGPDLRGTGLLPLFDGVRITRTAAVARRLVERGKAGSVFSAFSGESVADEHFLGELAETLHQRASLASQLVLSFTQGDVRGFSTPEWDSLADMRALGFRFALSAITDLDMDFEALAEQGFAFVKLDASVFLDGLPAPSGRLPSSDVCRHLATHGLTLVVDRIENDDQLARVFGFGVLLGQGQLFGGPRPVRADVVGAGRSRTAAA
jgi:cyclic-di-GMP phosphodiesterase TipF (flagellum assembly factor)